MTMELTEAQIVILSVIRGEMPLSTLASVGIDLRSESGGRQLSSEEIPVVVVPSVADVASGLLAKGGNPDELRAWALFLLGQLNVDLSKLESHAQGDLLLNALWDASFEGSVSETAIQTAENLAETQP